MGYKAFNELKAQLTQAPLLNYPSFAQESKEFLLQTDASAVEFSTIAE